MGEVLGSSPTSEYEEQVVRGWSFVMIIGMVGAGITASTNTIHGLAGFAWGGVAGFVAAIGGIGAGASRRKAKTGTSK